jgi:hypothetical protein
MLYIELIKKVCWNDQNRNENVVQVKCYCYVKENRVVYSLTKTRDFCRTKPLNTVFLEYSAPPNK